MEHTADKVQESTLANGGESHTNTSAEGVHLIETHQVPIIYVYINVDTNSYSNTLYLCTHIHYF